MPLQRTIRALTAMAVLAIIWWGLAALLTKKARAEELDWRWEGFHSGSGVRHRHRPQVRYYKAPDFVEEGRRYEIDARDARRCKDHHEEVVSTEHTENDNAMVSAHKLWSARVQWYWGSRFMNWDNAVDRTEVCDQSNAMDTLTTRLIDNATKLMGEDGKNVRCVIRAVPCAAPLEREEEARK